jgi:murein DD-endopeptidase MepM/ murein hydrolase activator NlpD
MTGPGRGSVRSAGVRARESLRGWWRRGRRDPAWGRAVRAGCAPVLFASGAALGWGWRAWTAEAVGAAGRVVASPPRGGAAETGPAFRQRYQTLREAETRAADRAEAALASVPVAVPARGRLTSSYTARRFHPILRRVRPHWGVDIAAPAGSPVVSTADGTVAGVATNASYGLAVDVAHREGEFVTRYAHLSAVLVREGQRVRRGEPIGRVGSTGLSTGPHLHYEVFVRGRRRDPALLFDPTDAAGLLP